jgi:hypothetical protein
MNTMTVQTEMALDTILQKPVKGIPSCKLHIMEHAYIEKIAGTPSGSYRADPEATYITYLKRLGACMVDQYIPLNPLTMGSHGFEKGAQSATTGIKDIVLDNIRIDSPEAAIQHMEQVYFPRLQKDIREFNEKQRIDQILNEESTIQEKLGPTILKTGYAFVRFPHFLYSVYGYENYFMAYALYPEIIEKCFSLQADYYLLNNRAAARAFQIGGLPPYFRLDHDMADSKGMLVNIKTLDKIWFPHFTRSLEPMLKTDVRMLWHCDGNLMDMVPRLLDVGLRGFQGFQYEDGMDYEKICRMKARDGENILILAGVSVTTTLPHKAPEDVKKELKWLVDNGPATGLFLGGSSSIAPGVPWENIKTLVDGLKYYREHGRS